MTCCELLVHPLQNAGQKLTKICSDSTEDDQGSKGDDTGSGIHDTLLLVKTT